MTGPADTAAANLRAVLDAPHVTVRTTPDYLPDYVLVPRDQLRAVLDEREQLVARVADLEAELPPICAHCKERNRDGSYTEHDASWMCAPCHIAAARGEDR